MEVLFDIYNDAYYHAINAGATEQEAEQYASDYQKNIASYLEDYYV